MKELTLPSGATLRVTLAPFAVSKALYQAVLEEAKGLTLDPKADVDVNLFKDMFSAAFASKKVELALAECLKRALYNNKHVDADTFEPEAAREDYMTVCFEVALLNLLPFTKNLTQLFSRIFQLTQGSLEQK